MNSVVARRLPAVDLLALAAHPRLRAPAVVAVRGWEVLVADPVGVIGDLDTLDRTAAALGAFAARDPALPPFTGGAVGYLSEDCSADLMGLPPDGRPPGATLPPLRFTLHDWAVAVDPDGRAWAYAAPDRIDEVAAMAGHAAPPGPAVGPARALRHGLTRAAHRAAVERILGWIAAGDCYQINLTFGIAAAWHSGPFALARRLWAASPGAAHRAVLTLSDGRAVVSISPETFLRNDGRWLQTRPIKGTRARASGDAQDAAAAEALRASPKDAAEHVMIVDLERNDLGRVCRTGSITVPTFAALRAHPTVWHLESTVRGRLRNDLGLRPVLAALFPSGSVTGAPKRMAVLRTRQVEPVRRGVYCGAIGVIGPGLVDLSVAIRTATLANGVAVYGTGGGIVADSDAGEEYDEALVKAAAFVTAVNADR